MYKFMTLKDHVYQYIAQQISKGELVPGEKINENEICRELNISRTPVREALIQLASEGVLENLPRKGFVIKQMEEAEARQLYQVIGALDGLAAQLACPALTGKHLKDMAFYIDSMELAINSGNYEMYYKQQENFHDIYISECGNDVLINALSQLKNKFVSKTYDLSVDGSGRKVLQTTNAEHRIILELFQKKDIKGLKEFLQETHWNPELACSEVII
ncbi:MAG: GntR family transcriptional regulator [Firmicutes bacterium]|nr:GntR family transcriptional regulator [Bacillota bacterium]